MPATPSDSTITPSSNLSASPPALCAATVFNAMMIAFPKRKHRLKVFEAAHEALYSLERRGAVFNIHDAEPVAQALARADAAAALRAVLVRVAP